MDNDTQLRGIEDKGNRNTRPQMDNTLYSKLYKKGNQKDKKGINNQRNHSGIEEDNMK